jgi:2'-5' RNA ligase superfamily
MASQADVVINVLGCAPTACTRYIAWSRHMSSRLVIVIFPRSDGLADLEDFRSVWDPLADSVPAHVTLVYPFESNIGQSNLETIVADVARHHRPFDVELGSPTVHEGEYLFLLPRRGRSRSNACTTIFTRRCLAPSSGAVSWLI